MKPILYEIRRVMLSKPLLLILLFIILLPALIAAYSAMNSGPSDVITGQAYAQGGNGTYNISIYLSDYYGVPWVNADVNITVNDNTSHYYTNSAGYVNLTFANVTAKEIQLSSYTFESNIGGSQFFQKNRIPIYNNQRDPYFLLSSYQDSSTGSVNLTQYTSRYTLNVVSARNNPKAETILISFFPADLVSFPDAYLYYLPLYNQTTQIYQGGGFTATYYGNLTNLSALPQFAKIPRSEMTLFGRFHTTPSFIVNPANLSARFSTDRFTFELFSENGTELAFVQIQLTSNVSAVDVNNIFFTSELPLLTLFVPVMTMLSAYLTFARDKCSGVLSSVIVRPLSRRSLITSRYVSNVVPIFLACAAALGLSSLIFHFLLGLFISASTILLSLWALFVMVGAFTGIVFLLGISMRTQGQIVALILAIFFTFDLLWTFNGLSIIPSLIATSIFGDVPGSIRYLTALSILNYVTPSGFPNLITYLEQGTIGSVMYGFYPPSRVGITVPMLLIAGLAWIVAPLMITYKIFAKAD